MNAIFNREHWQRVADGAAVALAVALPLSTSFTSIAMAVWVVALLPTLELATVRRTLSRPAAYLPVLLCLLAVVGVAWAFDVPMKERWGGLSQFLKLLVIPLLMIHFQRSERAHHVLMGYLVCCGAILAVSWLLVLKPDLPGPWVGMHTNGVPFKDYIAQSGEFTFCAFAVAALVIKGWQRESIRYRRAMMALAVMFFADVLYVGNSRTALVVVPVLLLIFALRYIERGQLLKLIGAGIVAGLLVAWLVPAVNGNVTTLTKELLNYKPGAGTRAGDRLDFWRSSAGFIASAPLIGHGTGSIREQFRQASIPGTVWTLPPSNPHNQTLAVGIQLGMLGIAVLLAMWLSHLLLFRGESMAAWLGLVIVVQNVVSSLFNSHLFDFTQGWSYAVGVGVCAGAVLRDAARR